ncbi:MAG: relaxase/mobilization nuclease domain-containing protein [Magnetococcales bacterium]|nr:relaxase/mobilization nuclease domain-containing protein [Magnetococcales bacterium]
MITKALTHKNRSTFRNLFNYLKRDLLPDSQRFEPITHNLASTTRLDIIHEFEMLADKMEERRNGVISQHHIISFKSGEKLSPDTLRALTVKWIELYGPDRQAYAELHFDRDHIHAHIIFSACDLLGRRKEVRVDKYQLQKCKIELQEYQKEKFPHLSKSIVAHRTEAELRSHDRAINERSLKRGPKRGEREALGRKQRKTQKVNKQKWLPNKRSQAKTIAQNALSKNTRAECFKTLSVAGFELYERRGKGVVGILNSKSGKRYRFATLETETLFRQAAQRWQKRDREQQQSLSKKHSLQR